MENDFNYVYEKLIEMGVATEKEIDLVCNINGNTIETLNDIIYARTGYHDLEQLCEYE